MNDQTIGRRGFLQGVVTAAGLACVPRWAWSDTPAGAGGVGPNTLFIMTDDQGWADTGYNGHPVLRTPNLDAMAKAGLRCDRFYAAAPVCSPTRGSCMTGRHPNRYALYDWGFPLHPRERTLGHLGRRAGLRTGFFGKWHLNGVRGMNIPMPADDPLGPGAMGFDRWRAMTGCYDNHPRFGGPEGPVPGRGEGTDLTTDATIRFIDEAVAEKKPFMAVAWYSNPHAGHSSFTEQDIAPYRELGIKGADRLAEIAAVDRNVGRLRAHLRERGVAENTLVIFCSDNGSDRGNTPLLGGKKTLLEGGIRVPGLVEWPAVIEAGRQTRMPVNTSDLYPTFLELYGVKVPDQPVPLDGISLLPLLRGEEEQRASPMFFAQASAAKGQASASMRNEAVIDGDLKLYRQGPRGKAKLVDLSEPGEREVTGDHPEVVAELTAALDRWQESVATSVRGEDYPGR